MDRSARRNGAAIPLLCCSLGFALVLVARPALAVDHDGDGYESTEDCNDLDPSVNPSADEVCNGRDDDCNGDVDEGFDQDGDGNTSCAGDCDDDDPAAFQGAAETCDGKDNDCDSRVDEGYDADGDGFLSCGENLDCNDLDDTVHPDAEETCNDRDDDCDGQTDEGLDCSCDEQEDTQPQDDDAVDGGCECGVTHRSPASSSGTALFILACLIGGRALRRISG